MSDAALDAARFAREDSSLVRKRTHVTEEVNNTREEPTIKLKIPPQWKNTLDSIMHDVEKCFEDAVRGEEVESAGSPHFHLDHCYAVPARVAAGGPTVLARRTSSSRTWSTSSTSSTPSSTSANTCTRDVEKPSGSGEPRKL